MHRYDMGARTALKPSPNPSTDFHYSSGSRSEVAHAMLSSRDRPAMPCSLFGRLDVDVGTTFMLSLLRTVVCFRRMRRLL